MKFFNILPLHSCASLDGLGWDSLHAIYFLHSPHTHTHTHTKMKLHENAVTQTGLRASPTQRVLAPSDPSSGPFTRLAWPCMTVLLFLSISPLSLALPCGDQLQLLATSGGERSQSVHICGVVFSFMTGVLQRHG